MLRQTGWLRALKWIAAVLVGAWVAYLLVANLFLNVNGIGFMVEKFEDTAKVPLGSAFTWWPGYVVANDLQVIVHDSNVEMDLRIDEVHTHVRLLSLFSKEFETYTATVTGVSLRLRETRPLEKLCKQRRGLPPIETLAQPPGEIEREACSKQIDTGHVRSGPPTPAEKLFRVRLGGLVVHEVRELWIERYHVTGSIDVVGRMNFWPTKEIGFAISELEGRGLQLEMAGRPRIKDADLEARGRMKNTQLQTATADETWKGISVWAKAKVGDVDLGFVEQLVSSTGPIAPPKLPQVDGQALLEGEIEIEEGVPRMLAVHVAAMQASLRLLQRTMAGRVVADLRLEPVGAKSKGVLALKKAKVVLTEIEIHSGDATQHYGDVKLEVSARDSSTLAPAQQRANLQIDAHSSQAGPLIDLMAGGFQRTIANIAINEDGPATVYAELYVDKDLARFEALNIDAGGLHVDGRMRLVPDPGGRLKISWHGIKFHVNL